MRGSAGRIRSVVGTLRSIPGVREVTADPRTGSVAFRYEPRPVVAIAVKSPAVEMGGSQDEQPPARIPAQTTLTRVVETVVIVALEVALQRVLGPFWPRRC